MRSRPSVVVAAGLWLLVLSLLMPTGRARADNNYWQRDPNTPGDWLDPNNWTLGVPGSGDSATINNGGEAQITSAVPRVSWVRPGDNGGPGSLSVESGGDLAVGVAIDVGFENSGSFTQTGGTTTTPRMRTYNGTCEFSGGTITVDDYLRICGPSGEFHQSGGQLVAVREWLGDLGRGSKFLQSGGTNTVFTLDMGRQDGTVTAPASYVISGGSLTAWQVVLRNGINLDIASSAAQITISEVLSFGAGSSLSAVPGAAVHMTEGADLYNENTDPAPLADLRHLNLIFEGGTERLETFEAAGQDLLATAAGYQDNFALGALILDAADVGVLQLVDDLDNRPDWQGAEALYVENLLVGAGCTLDLNGLNLYYLNADIDPAAIIENGTPVEVPATPGDANLDGIVNVADLGVLGANYHQTRRTWRTADFNCDGLVNVADLGMLGANYDSGGGDSLPEPTTVSLLAVGALGLLRRKR